MGDDKGVVIEDEKRIKINKEDFLENAFRTPASATIIFLLSVFIPLFGLFPSDITLSMNFAFSIPLIVLFIIGVGMNKEIGLKELMSKWFLIIIVLSYTFYILSRSPWEPSQFYFHTVIFLVGFVISFLTYFIYYIFYLLSKKRKGMSYRMRILIVFLPTLSIMIVAIMLLSGMVIGITEKEILTLGKWLSEWGGTI